MTYAGFRMSNDHAYWSPYTCRAFSAPQKFDLDAMASQAQSQLDRAEDHLWLLQTKPSYMRRYIDLIRIYEIIETPEKEAGFRALTSELRYV